MHKGIKWLALGSSVVVLAAAILLGSSALRRNRRTTPVQAAQTGTTQAAPPATTELTTESTTIFTPTTEEQTTEKPLSKPSTKAEIVDYFNASVNLVKSERPGYSWKDRILVDRNAIECSNRLLNATAPGVLRVVQPIAKFGEWQEKEAVAKGADHSEFPARNQTQASRLEPGFVKSAACTESGGGYQIKITLMSEDVPILPKSAASLRTGRVMNAWDATLLEDAKSAEPFITITNMETNYRDCQIVCTIDKETGRLEEITYTLSCILHVDVKQFGGANASLPFVREEHYAINNA